MSLAFSHLQSNMLQWLDEFCLHAYSKGNWSAVIEEFFDAFQAKGLLVHAWKIIFHFTRVKISELLLDASGVQFDPQGLATQQ